MKISHETLKVLKSFAHIRPGLCVERGYNISTINPEENLVAILKTEEEWPIAFNLYDLGSFLNTVSLFDDPDIILHDTHLFIQDSNTECKYYFSNRELLGLPKNGIIVPDIDNSIAQYTISQNERDKLFKAAAALGADILTISSDNDMIRMSVSRDNNDNNFTILIKDADYVNAKFEAVCNMQYMKFLGGDYVVNINRDKVILAEWNHTEMDLTYYVGMAEEQG